MKCPIDGKQLLITERHGVEIDYCPECRGVWLDRGELDKIIDGGLQTESRLDKHDERQKDSHDSKYPNHTDKYDKKRKRESFLSDLFDF